MTRCYGEQGPHPPQASPGASGAAPRHAREAKITRDTYAHLAPEAWQQDYARVSFRVPALAEVIALPVDARKMRAIGGRKASGSHAETTMV